MYVSMTDLGVSNPNNMASQVYFIGGGLGVQFLCVINLDIMQQVRG